GYGGSVAARMRLTLEVASAVRAAWPAHKPLGFRLPGADFIDGGLTVEDAVALGLELKGVGVDYLVPSIGLLNSQFAAPRTEPGYMVHFAERLRRDVGLPTMATGMILKPQQAEAVIAEGRADMVGLGRALLNDPRWGWHAATALGTVPDIPRPYGRVAPHVWPGYRHVREEEAAAAVSLGLEVRG
ncbi:MAG: oxidoreductase, partial [Janthinobacterium lividum]